VTTWQASFVASPSFVVGATDNPAAYLRRAVEVSELRSATLHVTALGLVEPWVNGMRVGDELLAPGWTSYDHRLAVSSYDVTALLLEGSNALGAVLGEGWAVGRVGWEGRRAVWADRPAVFVQLDVEDANGSWSIGTDESWRAGTGGVRSNSLFEGEHFDARLDTPAWCTTRFDDSDWPAVDVVDHDLSTLVPRTWEPIRAVEELAAREVITTPAGRTVVDFGQNVAGWVRLRANGPEGTEVTLHHSETLIHGEVDFETNRGAAATDVYVLRGDEGGETWEPRFTFHGFRYVDVEGWPGELAADDLTAVVVHSDMRRTGWFETSHPGLNQLHSNVVWSMRDNVVGVPTDCPQRDERAGWTGDINAFATTATYLYDVRGVLGSWLTDLSYEQGKSGSVPFVVPDVQTRPAPPTALWGDVAVNLPWVLHQAYGDDEVLRRQYPSMRAYVDQVAGLLDDNGLWSSGFQLGDWLDPDAPPGDAAGGKTDRHLVGSAFFCRTTEQLARTAEVLGERDDAERYARLHTRVRDAFRQEWVTPAGRLANESQTAYALVICFDVLESQHVERAGRRLAELVADRDFRIATGFAGTPFVVHALSRTGHLDVAYRLLLQEECPSFLYPLSKGATTIWERWDAIQPDGSLNSTGMTSLNHYALGAVADWLHTVVGGLSAAAPGYAALRIAPQPGGGLTRAATWKDTPHGRASVSWSDSHGTRTVEVEVPDGVTAEVLLPGHPDSLTALVDSGTHRWSYPCAPRPWPPIDLRTPIATLQQQPVWPDVMAIISRHSPLLTAAGPDFDLSPYARTLHELLQRVPYGPGIKEEVQAVLDRATR
jgi:alpha-L-rhamnosidase